jgi:glutathione S-transferase
MAELIFHHYPISPFSEKIRILFGIKGLSWDSVIIPSIMPKPLLVSLTGGYRKTPVLQIGADIYCDTRRIAAELERRFPEPSIYPDGSAGLCRMVAAWADGPFFRATTGTIFGLVVDEMPSEFRADREAMSGRSWDPAKMKAAQSHMQAQFTAQLAWLADQLADGRDFLLGAAPSLADAAACYNLWFLRKFLRDRADGILGEGPHHAWLERIAAIGRGEMSELDGEAALARARDARPAELAPDLDDREGFAAGAAVQVAAEDYGRDPVAGELVCANADGISIRRHDEQVGEVMVHFPREGFSLRPAKGR